MNAKTLAQVIIRVWGVMLMVGALASLGNVLMFLPGPAQFRGAAAASLMNFLVSFAAGVYFVRNGDKVGAWLASDLQDDGPPATTIEVMSAALAVLGVYFLVAGLRSGASAGVEWFFQPNLAGRQRSALASAVVDIAAGILVVAWSGRLWRSALSRSDGPEE